MESKATVKCDIPIEEVIQLAKEREFILLDVRTQAEVDEGKLPEALHIPVDQLATRIGELESVRNRTILCYCKKGGRADKAANLLRENEYSNAVNIGGYEDFVDVFK